MGDKGEVSKTIMWVYSHKQVTISRYVDLQRFSGIGKTTEISRTRTKQQDDRTTPTTQAAVTSRIRKNTEIQKGIALSLVVLKDNASASEAFVAGKSILK